MRVPLLNIELRIILTLKLGKGNALMAYSDFNFANRSLIIAYIFVAALIALPFYDPNNIPLNLANVAVLSSHFPALSRIDWVGGPFTLSIFLPAYFAYFLSSYNLYFAYLFYKIISVILDFAMGYLASTYVVGEKAKTRIFLIIFLNPVLLFVNFIWCNIVIFPIFFLFLSVYCLRKYSLYRHTSTVQIIGALSLIVSIFFYWYPLIVVPTLLIYSHLKRQKTFLFTFFIGSATLLLAYIFLMNPSLSIFLSTALGKNKVLFRPEISGFQYFVHLSALEYAMLIAISATLIPLLFKLKGYSEYFSIFVVLSILLGFSNISTPVDSSFILPFSFIPLFLSANARWKKFRWILLTEVLPLSTIFLITLRIGNTYPDGIGIFMWGYSLFHLNLGHLIAPSFLSTYFLIYNLTLLSALFISVFFVFYVESKDKSSEQIPREIESKIPSDSMKVSVLRNKTLVATLLAVIIILVPISIMTNNSLPTLVSQEGDHNFPVYYFLPRSIPDHGNVVPPITDQTYSVDRNEIYIYSNSTPIKFGRMLPENGISINLNFTFGTFASEILFLNSSTYKLFFSQTGKTLDNGSMVNLNQLIIENGNNTSVQSIPGKSVDLEIVGGPSSTTFLINGENYTSQHSLSYIFFGKLTAGKFYEIIDLSHFELYQELSNNYYIVPVFWMALFPYFVLITALWALRNPKSEYPKLKDD